MIDLNTLGVFYSAMAAVCMAIAPAFLKKGLEQISRSEMVTSRTIFFVASAAVLSLSEGRSMALPQSAGVAAFMILLTLSGNIMGDVSYFRAIQLIGMSRGITIASSYPIIVTLVSTLWMGEPLTLPVVMAPLLIVGGLVLLRREPGGASGNDRPSNPAGFLWALVAAFGWASMMLMQKWLITEKQIQPVTVTLWRSYSLFFICWTYWISSRLATGRTPAAIFRMGRSAWGWSAAAAVTGLGFSGFFFTKAMELLPVSVVTPISASSPLVTAAIGVLFMRERLTAPQWGGLLLILGGVISVNV
ncbi:MAG: DMT family transporter [Aminivibrio sp.]